jgi:hypothetical protein
MAVYSECTVVSKRAIITATTTTAVLRCTT